MTKLKAVFTWILGAQLSLGLLGHLAQAQANLEKTVTIESSDPSDTLQVLTERAHRKMAEDLIIEYIGVEAFSRNKPLLNSKVVGNYSRFAPFQKVQDVNRSAKGTQVTVQYKISIPDFRKMLADTGVVSKVRLAQNVIALMVLEDEDGNRQALSWKKMGSDEQQVLLHDWMGNFKAAFEKAGYTFNKNLNPAWLESFSENSSPQDILSKNSVPSSLVIWGVGKMVDDGKNKNRVMTAQIKVYSQEFKKEVTDSVRRFLLRDQSQQKWQSWGQDLVAQLDGVDAKSLNQGSLVKLILKGAMPLLEQDAFKQWILNSNPQIKSVTERRFEQKETIYEIEGDISPENVARKLGSIDFKGKKFRAQFSSSEIRLEAL